MNDFKELIDRALESNKDLTFCEFLKNNELPSTLMKSLHGMVTEDCLYDLMIANRYYLTYCLVKFARDNDLVSPTYENNIIDSLNELDSSQNFVYRPSFTSYIKQKGYIPKTETIFESLDGEKHIKEIYQDFCKSCINKTATCMVLPYIGDAYKPFLN